MSGRLERELRVMMTDDEPKTVQMGRSAWLVRIAATLIIAAPLSACGTAAIGPVDHECHANAARSQGSGCGNA
jgi:hypothetical protein